MQRTTRTSLVLILVIVTLSAAAPAHAARPGTVDTRFGRRGLAVVNFPDRDFAWKSAVQPDGKIVLAGRVGSQLGVVRLTVNGIPDRTFSGDGRMTIKLGTWAAPFGLALDRDGSIIIGAYFETDRRYVENDASNSWFNVAVDGGRFAIVRLRPNGALDASFGTGGVVKSQPDMVRPIDDIPLAMALTPAGQILVLAVRGYNLGYYGYPSGTVLMRFTRSGDSDRGFGIVGISPASYVGALPYPADVAVQPDGHILVLWSLIESGLGFIVGGSGSHDLVSRYLSSGVPDPTFGQGGTATAAAGDPGDYPWGLTLQKDGKIIVFGQSDEPGRFTGSMMRLLADGTKDRGFGSNGAAMIRVGPGSNIRGVAVQPDGRIVAAVNGYGANGIARFDTNGRLDNGFGTRGYRGVPLGIIAGVVVQGSRILAVGGLTTAPDGFAAFALTR